MGFVDIIKIGVLINYLFYLTRLERKCAELCLACTATHKNALRVIAQEIGVRRNHQNIKQLKEADDANVVWGSTTKYTLFIADLLH